jgi:putative ABC transport system permease protein
MGIASFGGAALGRLRTARGERARGALSTLAGLLIALVWLRTLAALPTVRGETRADAIAAAVGGLALIVTSVWTATRAIGPGLRWLDRGLSPLARLRLVVRPAAGYLSSGRWRTGLTVTMFGMVVFIMVASLTMIETLVNAYAGKEPPVAGFDLRADLPGGFVAGRLPDLEAALAEQEAVGRAAFGAIGGISSLDARIVQFGIPRAAWQNAEIVAADDGFLAGSAVHFERRAMGYDSDAAVWAALRDQPGLAVVTGSTASAFVTLPAGEGNFAPFTVWARPAEDGQPIKLTVIGVVDPRSEIDAGLWMSRTTAGGLGAALGPPTSYFLALAPGTVAQDAIEGLRVAFADSSLAVNDLSGTIRIGQSIRALLTQLVQGFMGLGLVAGVAALGILGIQSVIERRQQLGTLRAIGYTRGQTRATLTFESAVTAALGISLGTALGLILARSLVALLSVRNPEIRYGVPWDQIAITLALAWIGTLAALVVAAWQAGRVSPADALRAGG